ncbi:MAG TPA: hypothetical protein VGD40_03030 [Chryseosolibacter sp.]
MKKLIFLVTVMSIGLSAFAQDFIDNALLFSRTHPGGSARIQALGGTQTSLGGDYSSAFSNPGGLGMFNRSEFTITPSINFTRVTSDYLGTETDESKMGFSIPGLSLVYHHNTGRETGFLGGSFSISMNRVNDFNRNFRYTGTNSEHSLIDYFINDADGLDPETMLWRANQEPGDNFFTLTGLAYNNYLISDTQLPNGDYEYRSVLSPLPAENGLPAEIRTLDQQETSESRGAQTQWSISYGANFNDVVFLGAGIGISSIRYKIRQYFKESDFSYSIDEDYDPIDYYQTDEEYNIRGSGVNLTLGAIVRPVQFFQVGISYATPTYYNIVDNYNARIDSYWRIYDNDNPNYPDQPHVYELFDQPLTSEYNLSTPSRLSGGVTFISKMGFISFDIERANYAGARYDSNIDDDFNSENNAIKAEYGLVYNFRTGAEYRYEKYRVRAGFNYMPDPFTYNDVDQSIKTLSGGLGYRESKYFIDFAAVFSNTNRSRSPYFVNGPDPIAYQKYKSASYMLTFGLIF